MDQALQAIAGLALQCCEELVDWGNACGFVCAAPPFRTIEVGARRIATRRVIDRGNARPQLMKYVQKVRCRGKPFGDRHGILDGQRRRLAKFGCDAEGIVPDRGRFAELAPRIVGCVVHAWLHWVDCAERRVISVTPIGRSPCRLKGMPYRPDSPERPTPARRGSFLRPTTLR